MTIQESIEKSISEIKYRSSTVTGQRRSFIESILDDFYKGKVDAKKAMIGVDNVIVEMIDKIISDLRENVIDPTQEPAELEQVMAPIKCVYVDVEKNTQGNLFEKQKPEINLDDFEII